MVTEAQIQTNVCLKPHTFANFKSKVDTPIFPLVNIAMADNSRPLQICDRFEIRSFELTKRSGLKTSVRAAQSKVTDEPPNFWQPGDEILNSHQ